MIRLSRCRCPRAVSIIFVIPGFGEAPGRIPATSLYMAHFIARRRVPADSALCGFCIVPGSVANRPDPVADPDRTFSDGTRNGGGPWSPILGATRPRYRAPTMGHLVHSAEKLDAREGTMCTRHYHSPWPLSIHRHHRRPNPYSILSAGGRPRYPLSHSTRWKFSGIIRDLRQGKRARQRSLPAPTRGTYLGLYARKMNSVISRSRFCFCSPFAVPRSTTMILGSGILVYSPSTPSAARCIFEIPRG